MPPHLFSKAPIRLHIYAVYGFHQAMCGSHHACLLVQGTVHRWSSTYKKKTTHDGDVADTSRLSPDDTVPYAMIVFVAICLCLHRMFVGPNPSALHFGYEPPSLPHNSVRYSANYREGTDMVAMMVPLKTFFQSQKIEETLIFSYFCSIRNYDRLVYSTCYF